jgi:excisionase family DNA binding protein
LLLTVAQAAEQMGVSESLAWVLVRQHKLPSVRISERAVRVPRAALEALCQVECGGPSQGAL